MKDLSALFSHSSDDWATPKWLYDRFVGNGFVDCFPFKADYDEFKNVYLCKKLFVNPPFSKLKFIPEWIEKQLDNGCDVVLLMPARTDTLYFHKLLKFHPKITFIQGRLSFNEIGHACFPTILLTFHSNYEGDLMLWDNLLQQTGV